jgi:hypothetical protein
LVLSRYENRQDAAKNEYSSAGILIGRPAMRQVVHSQWVESASPMEIMAERSIPVYHATMHRWIVCYSLELLERFNRRKRSVSRYPKTFAVMDIVIPPREW